jgi:Concanavalin A-like lectin/glucanases superfamily
MRTLAAPGWNPGAQPLLDQARMSRRSCRLIVALAGCLLAAGTSPAAIGGFSLRFHGNGVNDIDRVKIPLDPELPVDVGATDFTVEWWMKANPGENSAGPIAPVGNNWIFGNVIIDRDVFGNGDYGDYGVSLGAGRVAFGIGTATGGDYTIVGTINVTDGLWHHIAVTRRPTTGRLEVYVDGVRDASGIGPVSNISYRNNRLTAWPGSDPYLVIGAEKHDAGPAYPSYHGWIDELRVSRVIRYTTAFARPMEPFVTDSSTAALYHFDEGSGNVIGDTSGAPFGPSHGTRRVGGSPAGPEWSTDTPWGLLSLSAPVNLRVIR